MNDNPCLCLSGGQCRISKEEFGKKLEAKELIVAHWIRLETAAVPLLDFFFPERFGAVGRHKQRGRAKLKRLAEQSGFDHVRPDSLFQSGVLLDEFVIQEFTLFRERSVT